MKIEILNYRGIEHAALDCAPLALVGAPNGGGKTSVCEAVAAALTGIGIAAPLDLAKSDAARILHRGADRAAVTLTTEAGTARMTWPDCALETHGEAPKASAFAVGQKSLPELPAKDRAAALLDYLKAAPTEADLSLEMSEQFKAETITALWQDLAQRGWDAVAQEQETARRDAGRDWSKLTGTGFGSDKAARWTPEGWVPALDNASEAELILQLQDAKTQLETAIANTALDEAETARLSELAALVETRRLAIDTATTAVQQRRAAEQQAHTHRNDLPGVTATTGLPCPHCGGPLAVRGGLVEKFTSLMPDEIKRRRTAIAEADGALSRLTAERAAAERALAGAQEALQRSETAATTLATLPSGGGDAAALPAARERVQHCEITLALWRKTDLARGYYRSWRRADLILKIVQPAGLRAKKMGRAVSTFNAILAGLCDTAGWAAVDLTEELGIRYGERPYGLISKSEQYRVRAILAVAQARLDGSALVIFDGADILDVAGRNGLLRLLAETGLPALIGLTTLRDPPPDLGPAGLGTTYVIDAARTRPVTLREAA